MTNMNRIASDKHKLDMVLLCINNQFGLSSLVLLVKFGFVWQNFDWCG